MQGEDLGFLQGPQGHARISSSPPTSGGGTWFLSLLLLTEFRDRKSRGQPDNFQERAFYNESLCRASLVAEVECCSWLETGFIKPGRNKGDSNPEARAFSKFVSSWEVPKEKRIQCWEGRLLENLCLYQACLPKCSEEWENILV